jgi:hypothetical protein
VRGPIAFVGAFLGVPYHSGIAILFVVSLVLLMISLIELVRDVQINWKTMRLE